MIKIVCLGGGIGTVNLVKGLKAYSQDITVVLSMADEGGSSGRLRRLYNIFPPGDLVSCMGAMVPDETEYLSQVLTYRFPGNRYGADSSLPGHKLGNLIMVAMRDVTGSFEKAIELYQKTFAIPGVFLPATSVEASISAKTIEGVTVTGEENIDLGKYSGERVLDRVYLHPENAPTSPGVVEAIENSEMVIAGPGDLYTTILPVLLVPDIAKALSRSKAKKVFIVNVANKPFETKGYSVMDFVKAIRKHLNAFPFDTVIVNNNTSIKIPKKYHYTYVQLDNETDENIQFLQEDLVSEEFPLYHSPAKLAKLICETI